MAKFEVEWTGHFPNLCRGKWKIKKDGCDLSRYIPKDLHDSPMNTEGSYERWHFTDGWEDVWENYSDGLPFEDWIEENKKWVSKIAENPKEQSQLYEAIREKDWRHDSCGGCI